MNLRLLICCLLASIAIAGCRHDGSDPDKEPTRSGGLEYAPQMYDSYPYEPYKQIDYNPFNISGANVRHPVVGTIARGFMNHGLPFGPEPTNMANADAWNAGYAQAAAMLRMPDSIRATDDVLGKAQKLFSVFCDHCHGAAGLGDGPISKAEKIVVPSFKGAALLALTPGQMFYAITYGKNAMGAHASQTTPEERWMLVHHIHKLQGRQVGPGVAAAAATAVLPAQPDTVRR